MTLRCGRTSQLCMMMSWVSTSFFGSSKSSFGWLPVSEELILLKSDFLNVLQDMVHGMMYGICSCFLLLSVPAVLCLAFTFCRIVNVFVYLVGINE